MRRATRRRKTHAIDAPRRRCQSIIGRLAVDQILRTPGKRVCGLRAVAAALLAGDEHQSDAPLARLSQTLSRRNLRDQNAFRVARAATVKPPVCFAAWKERRYAVEMRGEDNGRLAQGGDHVESALVQRLFDDVVPQIAQRRRQKDCGVTFAAGRRVDVDELPGQLNLVQRIHASSPVRVSVRSSRYFTMTGVASESPQSRPAPD